MNENIHFTDSTILKMIYAKENRKYIEWTVRKVLRCLVVLNKVVTIIYVGRLSEALVDKSLFCAGLPKYYIKHHQFWKIN